MARLTANISHQVASNSYPVASEFRLPTEAALTPTDSSTCLKTVLGYSRIFTDVTRLRLRQIGLWFGYSNAALLPAVNVQGGGGTNFKVCDWTHDGHLIMLRNKVRGCMLNGSRPAAASEMFVHSYI